MSASVVASRSASWASMSSLDDTASTASSSCPTGGAPEAVLTIEELRLQLNSCFTCGVSWQEDHVSLDCGECGGYSLARPCPLCEGRCGQVWKRDVAASHATGRAAWCSLGCSAVVSSPGARIVSPAAPPASLRPQTASASS